jgi:ubiquinone/menaquinone biosynthesis C-methylase UbiE
MIFDKVVNNTQPDSFSTKMRKKRFSFFRAWLSAFEPPITILDVGGTESYWKMMALNDNNEINITLLNTIPVSSNDRRFTHVIGDGCNLGFHEKSFDVVFSNSVIEHVGDFSAQQKMAQEARRVGRGYFIQTPNRDFFLEPHFLFPFFQYLPINWRVWLLMHFRLGWFPRQNSIRQARQIVESIRLVNKTELMQMFPDGKCYTENVFGLSKSFTVYSELKRNTG